jgi:outer membrane protein OmpA-like peptidoglycan-associated protein
MLSLAGLGCSAKEAPMALENARTTYAQVQTNPQVSTHAPVALYEAEQSLRRAEQVWQDDHDAEEVQHLAYVTTQRVGIAKAVAEKGMAEANLRQLNAERERILLDARTRAAESARQEAAQAQRDATRAQEETVQAQQQARDATARAQQLAQELSALQAHVKQTERGLVLTLGDVLFEVNQATLNSGAARNLYPLVSFLKDYPARQVIIEGHTDNTGAAGYNLDLSQRRAQAVWDFLLQNGVSSTQIISRGLGEGYPVASNTTEAGRQQNRRVEVIISQ